MSSDINIKTQPNGDLSCDEYGGPSNEIARKEMVYWRHTPKDLEYTSPYFRFEQQQQRWHQGKTKYITFEWESAGLNNIRMALENLMIFAHSTGRTLVLPPRRVISGMNKQTKGQTYLSLEDFFNLTDVSAKYAGINIISMEEFLQQEAMEGNLYNQTNKTVVEFPPGNRTDWNGKNLYILYRYLRKVAHTSTWGCYNSCLVAFPKNVTTPYNDIHPLRQVMNKFHDENKESPPLHPVNGTIEDRMYDLIRRNKRRDLCFYTPDMQNAFVLHFAYSSTVTRLLINFSSLIFFEDWKQDLWAKRFIRDSIRFIDEFQCAAARVVEAIRKRARANNRMLRQKRGYNETTDGNDEDGAFDALHIRRGDFLIDYEVTAIDIETIYENCKDELLPHGSTLFIATDDPNRTLLEPFIKRYNVLLLDDFIPTLLQDLQPYFYSIVDQLVASRGRVFFGTFLSTFSSYIHRIRGYQMSSSSSLSLVDKSIDVVAGGTPSYYHVPLEQKFVMTKYTSVVGPYWAREFPVGWRDIDFDI